MHKKMRNGIITYWLAYDCKAHFEELYNYSKFGVFFRP